MSFVFRVSNQFENDDNNPILDRSNISKTGAVGGTSPEKERDLFEYQEPVPDIIYEPIGGMEDYNQGNVFEGAGEHKEDGNLSKLSESEEHDVSVHTMY